MLGVEGAGLVAFAVWLALILTPVVDGGMALTVGRFLPDLKGQNETAAANALPGRLARNLLFYNLAAMAALAGLYAVAARAIPDAAYAVFHGPAERASVALILLVAALVLFQSFALFGTAYLRGSQKFVRLAILTAISMISQILCVYLGGRFFGVTGTVGGYLLGQVYLAAAAVRLLWRGGDVTPNLARRTQQYARFSWAANVCNTFVWSRIEILFLQSYWGFREVGLFSVALALSALASQGPLLLTGAFLQLLAEKHGRDDRQGLQFAFESGTRLLALLAFPACFGMAAVVPVLLVLLYGPAFAPAVPASMIIVTAAAFSITTVIGTHLVNAVGRSDFIFWSSLAGAVLSAILGFALIPSLGLLGAAISRTITQLAMVGLGLWFITDRLGFSYPLGSLWRILLSSLAASLAAFAVVNLVGHISGLIAAVVLAFLVYTVCLRLFGAMHPNDIALSRRLCGSLPSPASGALLRILSFLLPDSAQNRPAAS
jgi:O-antigen/teichoic acid export membrane protein